MWRVMSWARKSNGEAQAAVAQQQPRITLEHLTEFLRYFPIGTRLQYYPEYEKNIHLDTVILAYKLNGILVYSNETIRVSQEEENSGLLVTTENGECQISNLDSFHFVVPKGSRILVDYTKAATEGSENQLTERAANDFRIGNTITLINKGTNGKIHDMDTTITRVTLLTEGYYAKRHVAYLQPIPESLATHSTREFVRIYTDIPASLTEVPDGEAHPCTILDFSERALRLKLAEGDRFFAGLLTGKSVFISFALPPASRVLLLQATILRKQESTVVLSLTGMLKGRRFEKLDLIDEVELKASILQRSASQSLCSVKERD